MLLGDKFVFNQNRMQVFNTLLTLDKYYPTMELAYRDGRRIDDHFKDKTEPLNLVSYDKVKYSGEWRVFLSNEENHVFSLRFVNDCLQPFNSTECSIDLPVMHVGIPSKSRRVTNRFRTLIKRLFRKLNLTKSKSH
jgi:hypothetical protein